MTDALALDYAQRLISCESVTPAQGAVAQLGGEARIPAGEPMMPWMVKPRAAVKVANASPAQQELTLEQERAGCNSNEKYADKKGSPSPHHEPDPTSAAMRTSQSGVMSGVRTLSMFNWPLSPAVRCTDISRHSGDIDMRTIAPRSG